MFSTWMRCCISLCMISVWSNLKYQYIVSIRQQSNIRHTTRAVRLLLLSSRSSVQQSGPAIMYHVETDRNLVSVSAPNTTIWTVSASFVFGRILIFVFRQRFGFGRKSFHSFGGVQKVDTSVTIYATDQMDCSDCVSLCWTQYTAVDSGYKSVHLCIRSVTAVSCHKLY